MRKHVVFRWLLITALLLQIGHILVAFAPADGKDQATANRVDGLYIFTDSRPAHDYETLGTVKVGMTMGSGQYRDVRDKLIKKAHKDYPSGEAIIISTNESGADNGEVIRFK